jgi:hypothetical protein
LTPGQIITAAGAGGRTHLGIQTVHLEVTQFRVGSQVAVHEEPGTDSGAEGQHDDHTLTPATGAEGHLGDPRCVGVVEHVHLAMRHRGEQRVGIHVDPRGVDVGGTADHPMAHHGGKCHPDRSGPSEVIHQFGHHRRHGFGCGRTRGVDAEPLAGELTRTEIDRCSFHPGTTDVDPEAEFGWNLRCRLVGHISEP